MFIKYSKAKDVKCFQNFVQNPDDRNALRNFSKIFGTSLMEPAKKLHDRLKRYASAGAYNAVYGKTKNGIEIKKGCANKDPLILKVRVGEAQRKFFNHIIDDNGNLLQTQNWQGDFNSIISIFVIAVNNHDYKNI